MPRTAAERDYISVSEAALLAGVDRATVWKWIKAETLAAFRLPSGRTRVRRRDIVKPKGRA